MIIPKNVNTVFVFGAGAEKSLGMPLFKELFLDLYNWTVSDECGKAVEKKLHSFLGSKFSYASVMKDSADILLENLETYSKEILDSVKDKSSDDGETKTKKLIVQKIFERLKNIAENVSLENDNTLKQALEKDSDETSKKLLKEISTLEKIFDLKKISFTSAFTELISNLVSLYLDDGKKYDYLEKLFEKLTSYETLLTENFTKLCTGNQAAAKRYLYLSWTLWAFLYEKQKAVDTSAKSVYKNIKPEDNDYAISLNYTNLVDSTFGDKVVHFHGDLNHCINYSTRQENEITSSEEKSALDVLNDMPEFGGKFSKENFVIPAMMPPITIKPALSEEYIERWYKAKSLLDKAENIVVVGYSFGDSDGHFNMLVESRAEKGVPVKIVSPDAKKIKNKSTVFKKLANVEAINKSAADWSYGK